MRHGISKNSVKGRNLQAAYVDGLTLGNFFAFNQELNKMGDEALPFKIHPEHFIFAGVHGGQEVMKLIEEYGQPTYQKIFISLDAEKPVIPDADTKISMAGDTATLMPDPSLDIKMYGMHQFKMKKGGLRIKLGVFSPEATPSEMVLGHHEHLAVEFFNSLAIAYQNKTFRGKLLNTLLKFKKFK